MKMSLMRKMSKLSKCTGESSLQNCLNETMLVTSLHSNTMQLEFHFPEEKARKDVLNKAQDRELEDLGFVPWS